MSATAVHRRVIDRRVGAVMAVCAALYGVFIWRPSFELRGQRWFTIFDDAMISMTYARNAAEGHGLVWNVGQPPVEGYTNPLWTVYMAGIHRAGVSEQLAPLAVSIGSALLVLGCVALAALIAARLRPASSRAPVIAAALVGLYYPLVYWALRGMEVGLVTFLVLAGVLLCLRLRAVPEPSADDDGEGRVARDAVLLGIVVMAGLLTRDDFVVPAAVFGVWALVVLRGRARLMVVGAIAVSGLVAAGGQLAFRQSYYGEALPNTYYLKVAGQPVGPRLERGALTLLAMVLADLVVVIGLVVAGLRLRFRRRPDAGIGLALAMVAALAVYAVYVGGDAWEWARLADRYVTPAGVLLLVLAAVAIEPLADLIRRARRPVVALVVVVASGLAFGLVDSWLGVLFHEQFGEHLGLTPTGSDAAVLVAAALAVVIGVARFAGGRRRLPPRLAASRVLVPILTVAVLLSVTGCAWTSWVRDGGFYTAKNQGATAYGVVLREITDPGASIAVIWAGAPIYYSHRDGVDLLGKMDPVIAHGPHHEGVPMYPGHDKFDFDHSIVGLRPDLIAQYAWFTDADIDRFVAAGYVPMRFVGPLAAELAPLDVPRALLWVRNDSTFVHRDALAPVPIDDAKALSIER